ncbi:Myo-inositol transporter 1 [Cyphellophora attinorum]|uniref:Myo-inositol transporter 1 n=1 Tax=Cyphellophora attinorum TaxID=1664694 RepID=A0A0N1H6U0_9EURO|nr:Myo-inositol transporter 1 [Phialophora attinorum]KPI41893.1 Myo-inositol transporter 1 [Phialophora attinorum]
MSVPHSSSTEDHEPLIPNDYDEYSRASGQQEVSGFGNAFIWTLTLSACVSALLFGYDTGVISSTLVSIGTSLSQRNLTNLDKGLITSSTSAFALIASPIAGVLADRIGRKNIIILADVLFVLGAICQAWTTSIAGMIAGRSIVGLAIGAASLITPLYISELAPSGLRGRLVTVSVLYITLGQVVAYVVGWLFSGIERVGWRWMVGLGAIPAAAQIAMLIFMPESPRMLCKRGRQAEARAVIVKVHNGVVPDAGGTAEDIVKAIDKEINEEYESRIALTKGRPAGSTRMVLPPTLSSLMFHPPHRRALTITCMLQGLQQLCGFNSLMYFSATIFQLLGFTSPTLTSLSIAGTNFLFTVGAFYLIDRIGRRRILLFTIPVMVLALLLCAGSFTFLDLPTTDPSSSGSALSSSTSRSAALAILASLMLYVAGYASGLGVVPWQQSELFPLSVRSVGSSLATATNWGSNTIVGLTFLPMMQWLGSGWTFVIYAAVCGVGWLLVWRIYPETMGLGLEEVGGLLSDDWGVKSTREGGEGSAGGNDGEEHSRRSSQPARCQT